MDVLNSSENFILREFNWRDGQYLWIALLLVSARELLKLSMYFDESRLVIASLHVNRWNTKKKKKIKSFGRNSKAFYVRFALTGNMKKYSVSL